MNCVVMSSIFKLLHFCFFKMKKKKLTVSIDF